MTSFLAILVNVLWGSAYPANKKAFLGFSLNGFPAGEILFAGMRMTLASLFLLVVFLFLYKKPPIIEKGQRGKLVLVAFFQTFMEYSLFYVGLGNTTGAGGSVMSSTNAFFSVILAHFVYKDDKIDVRKAIGLALGFAGVILSTYDGKGFRFAWNGEFLVMLSAFVFSIGSLIGKGVSTKENPLAVAIWNLGGGGLALMALGIALGGKLDISQGITPWIYLLYLSAVSATTFGLWTYLLRNNPVGKISVYYFLIPVSGTFLSGIFLGENVWTLRCLFSLLLVSLGIVIIYLKHRKHELPQR